MTRADRRAAHASRAGMWFAPKRFGYGATPVTWQGWLTTASFAAVLVAVLRWAPSLFLKVGLGVPLTALFIWFVWTRTEGGWHWRWGADNRD